MLYSTNFLSDGNPPQLMVISVGLTRPWKCGGILNAVGAEIVVRLRVRFQRWHGTWGLLWRKVKRLHSTKSQIWDRPAVRTKSQGLTQKSTLQIYCNRLIYIPLNNLWHNLIDSSAYSCMLEGSQSISPLTLISKQKGVCLITQEVFWSTKIAQ